MNYEMDLQWHKDFLVLLAKRIRPKCYLELGLWYAPALVEVAPYCVVCWGVDREHIPEGKPENAVIVRLTTDEFFATMKIPAPELVFIDADHDSEQVVKDIENVNEIAAENCVVVIHDTFPGGPEYTVKGHCSDSYRVPGLIGFERVTLPTPPGVTVCRLRPRGLWA